MRTTLTLDPDVAALAQRVQSARGCTFKAIINEALRQGLRGMETPSSRPVSYRTPSVDLGRCLVGSLDDVAEALVVAEGDGSRFDSLEWRNPLK